MGITRFRYRRRTRCLVIIGLASCPWWHDKGEREDEIIGCTGFDAETAATILPEQMTREVPGRMDEIPA